MHPEATYQRALELIASGLNDCQVSREISVPRSTVRGWRVAGTKGKWERSAGGSRNGSSDKECPQCGGAPLDRRTYSYLLGMYLGDGCISKQPKGVSYRLRVACDLKYPDIINQVANAMAAIRGVNRVGFCAMEGCVDVNSSWAHWPCLFPQHGPGRKHERIIQLSPWQQQIVDSYTEEFLRGLIHSDGNRHINEVVRRFNKKTVRYRYVRYMFTNASLDIREIFTKALANVGVGWTYTGPRIIAVSRREDVKKLDGFIGPKR